MAVVWCLIACSSSYYPCQLNPWRCHVLRLQWHWPFLYSLCLFHGHSSQFLVSFPPLPPLCVTMEFPPSFLPPSSLSSLCCFSVSSLSLFSLSSLLLCISAVVSPNSNSVGLSVGTSIFISVLFRTHLMNQINAVFVKNKSLSTSQPNLYLKSKSSVNL